MVESFVSNKSAPKWATPYMIDAIVYWLWNALISSDYSKKWKEVYHKLNKIDWVDSKTFVLLDRNYAKDKNYVYSHWEVIDWACVETFWLIWSSGYAKDSNHIYFDWKPLELLDIAKFQIFKVPFADKMKPEDFPYDRDLGYTFYSWDGRYVYYGNKLLEWADFSTFIIDDYGIARDKNSLYIWGRKMSWVNPSNCRIYGNHLGEIEFVESDWMKIAV